MFSPHVDISNQNFTCIETIKCAGTWAYISESLESDKIRNFSQNQLGVGVESKENNINYL